MRIVRCLLSRMSFTFNRVWRDLIRTEYKDGGYENTREVIRYIGGLSESKRQAFLNELISVALNKSDGWGIALAALESVATPNQIRTLCENVHSLSEDSLIYVLRVLAKDPTGDCLAHVEKYLLKGPLSIKWTALPWALWPHHQDLFVKAWVRYFTTRPSEDWRNTIVSQAFLSRADAIAALKPQLLVASSLAWDELRSALQEHRNAPWLSDQQRLALAEVLS